MKNPYSIKNYKFNLPEYYYEYDYGFPNLNFCVYSFGSKKNRMDRIEKMYYFYPSKSKYWFKIIK